VTDAQIQLPADGAGKRVATQSFTRDAQTLHREEVIAFDFLRAVSLGLVEGYSLFRRFGRNPQITTSTDPEDIWAVGGTITYPTTAAAVAIVSSDADDTSGGSGARTLSITYLDASYVAQTETVTLSGTTPVTTAGSAIRVIRAFVATAGASGGNEGTITMTIGGDTQAAITVVSGVGQNQTQISHYTVPDGKTAHLLDYVFTQNGGNSNTLVAFVHRPEGGVWRPVDNPGLEASGTSSYEQTDVLGVSFPEHTDLKGVVQTVTSTVAISMTYELLLVDD